MRRTKTRLHFLSALIWLGAMSLSSGSGYAQQFTQEFSLMCNLPLFAATEASTIDPGDDKRRCEEFRNRFNQHLTSQGFEDFIVRLDFADGDDAVNLIVLRSVGKNQPIDVWIGGARYLHDIAKEKDLVAETTQVSNVEWQGREINVSITRGANNYRFAYLFIIWIREEAKQGAEWLTR